MANKQVIINDWQSGISDNVFSNFYDMRSCDIYSMPGVIKTNYRLYPVTNQYISTTFTANDSTDVITLSSAYANGDLKPVSFTTTGTLPAGLSTGTTYWVIQLSNTTYKVASTYALAVAGIGIDITSTGSGTHTMTSEVFRMPKYFMYGYNNEVVFLTENGLLWSAGTTSVSTNPLLKTRGNTLTNASGNGLCYYKGYYFVFRNQYIDVFNRKTSNWTGSWTNSWKTLKCGSGDSSSHKAIVAMNDRIYYIDNNFSYEDTNKSYIGCIQENSGQTFDPSDASTYTFDDGTSTNGLDINTNGNKLTDIVEFGKYIVVSAGNNLYFWDKYSPSYLDPVIINDNGTIQAMINYNNTIYCFMSSGNIYATNGSSVSFINSFPMHLLKDNNGNQHVPIFNNGGVIVYKNKILFNVCGLGDSKGVWSLNTRTGSIICENRFIKVNTDRDEQQVDETDNITTGALWASKTGFSYAAGWKNIDENPDYYSIDVYDGYRYGSDSPYFISKMMYDEDGFNNIDVILLQPLDSGDSISIYYRDDINDSWTLLGSQITANTSSPNTDHLNRKHSLTLPTTSKQLQIKCLISSYLGSGISNSHTSPIINSLIIY